jgi:heme-degrading monooxygenase HmoA
MIVRIWMTTIDEDRGAEYEAFAHAKSLPMFQAQLGNLGVFFTRSGERRAVMSLWSTESEVSALADSESYQGVSRRISATGFLVGEPVTESWACDDGWLDPALVQLFTAAERRAGGSQRVKP